MVLEMDCGCMPWWIDAVSCPSDGGRKTKKERRRKLITTKSRDSQKAIFFY
jgi:hypothetical protein